MEENKKISDSLGMGVLAESERVEMTYEDYIAATASAQQLLRVVNTICRTYTAGITQESKLNLIEELTGRYGK